MNIIIILFSAIVFFVAVSSSTNWSHYALMPDDNAVEESSESSKLSNTTKYCYHFTWMGGNFNNRTFKNIRNKTCSQYFKDKKTLCINPMVATFKGGPPNISYILENHATEATCRLSQEQACVKYTVYYNGIISYETRYCSQINVEMEGPMDKGCIEEKRGSETIEVCACKSNPGPMGICNSAHFASAKQSVLSSVLFLGTYFLFLR